MAKAKSKSSAQPEVESKRKSPVKTYPAVVDKSYLQDDYEKERKTKKS
jgi:hypothetical protein